MNRDLLTISSLRRVLESAEAGMGMAQSLVRELGHRSFGADSARMLLLGLPLSVSLRPLVESGSEEVSMLASLILSSPRSSSVLVGRRGDALAGTLERWVKLRENSVLQQKDFAFRSLITSGVLGGVTAAIAALGPLIGSLDLGGAASPVGTSALTYGAAVFSAMGSGMLGLFVSGKGFVLNVAISLATFTLVSALASPLASIPAAGLWGVK